MECNFCVAHYEYIKYNLFCINCEDNNQYHILDRENCTSEIPQDYYKTNDDMEQLKNMMKFVKDVLNVVVIVEQEKSIVQFVLTISNYV